MKRYLLFLSIVFLSGMALGATGDLETFIGKTDTALTTVSGKTGTGVATVLGKNYTDGDVACPDFEDTVPTTDGAVTNWSASSGTDKFAMVDDPVGTPDDTSTYIYKNDTGVMQGFYNLPAVQADCPITSVIVKFRGRYTNYVDGVYCRGNIRVNGTSYGGSDRTMTDAYADYMNTWTTNPNTGLAWTEADIEGTGAAPLQYWGVESRGMAAGETVEVTQCYIEVNYD